MNETAAGVTMVVSEEEYEFGVELQDCVGGMYIFAGLSKVIVPQDFDKARVNELLESEETILREAGPFNHPVIRLCPPLSLGGVVWDSAFYLVQYYKTLGAEFLKGKKVLSLGEGNGFLGLALAELGASVVMTDRDSDALALLDYNIRANAALRPGYAAVQPVAQKLVWARLPDIDSVGGVDLVLAADCIYGDKCVADLVDTFVRLAENSSSPEFEIKICQVQRAPNDDDLRDQLDTCGFEFIKQRLDRTGEGESLTEVGGAYLYTLTYTGGDQ